MIIPVPWHVRTRQEEGALTEKRVLKDRGARQHPRSGAGSIKEDGSTDEDLIEVKDANLTFGLKGSDLLTSWRRAARQNKRAVWVVRFANGVEAEIHLSRRAG